MSLTFYRQLYLRNKLILKTRIMKYRMKDFISSLLLLSCSLFIANIQVIKAQPVHPPNIRVNDVSLADAQTTGAQSIAVYNNNVYVVWEDDRENDRPNVFFARSTNGGISFGNDINLFPGPETQLHVWPSIATDQAGNIFVAWTAVTGSEQELYNIWMTKSIDGGVSFLPPVEITTNGASVFPVVGAFNNNVYVFYADASDYPCANYYLSRSTNSGANFETPVQVNDTPCFGNVKFELLTSMTVDPLGSIYLAWVDGRRVIGNGDIFFSRSDDGGVSFSPNVMVNDVHIPAADSVQFNPSFAVFSDNKICIAFTDMRLGDNEWGNHRVYYSVSMNGGINFTTESLLANHDNTVK